MLQVFAANLGNKCVAVDWGALFEFASYRHMAPQTTYQNTTNTHTHTQVSGTLGVDVIPRVQDFLFLLCIVLF